MNFPWWFKKVSRVLQNSFQCGSFTGVLRAKSISWVFQESLKGVFLKVFEASSKGVSKQF